MKLSIYTPEKPLLIEQSIQELIVPSVKGELDILPGHASLVSLLQAGVLKYFSEGSWEKVAIGWGYLEIANEEIKVLAESAQTKEMLDLNKVKQDLKDVESKLQQVDLEPRDREDLEKERLRLQGEADL